tara:strand:- start:538 stop:921 length:384 start_codon:yes stop_codon:yes gene_type:complete
LRVVVEVQLVLTTKVLAEVEQEVIEKLQAVVILLLLKEVEFLSYLYQLKVIQLQLVAVDQALLDLVILTKQVVMEQIQFFQAEQQPAVAVAAVQNHQLMVEHPQDQEAPAVAAEPIVNQEQQETLLL